MASLLVVLGCGGRTSLGTHRDASASMDSGVDADDVPDAQVVIDDAGIARTLTTLASGQKDPYALTIDDGNVYWTTGAGGTVMKHPKSGGTSTILASNQIVPGDIAVDAKYVYWTTDDSIRAVMRCPLGGCGGSPTSISNDHPDFSIAVDGSNVYYARYGQQPGDHESLVACSTSGCGQGGVTLVADSISGIGAITVRGGLAYWTDRLGGTVSKCMVSDCKPTTLATHQFGLGIALDGKNIYWTSPPLGTVMKCAIGGCGGKPTILASGQSRPTGIATDGAFVYWTNLLGAALMKCSVDGCGGGPETLVDGQAYPHPIAVDDTSVYWANINDGTIRKLTPK